MQDLVQNFSIERHANNTFRFNIPTGVTKARKSITVVRDFQKENDTEMRAPVKKKIKRTAKRIKSQSHRVHHWKTPY